MKRGRINNYELTAKLKKFDRQVAALGREYLA